ncbi:Crp/Fnr family transcriptional regulator [Hydrogenophaga atypica]
MSASMSFPLRVLPDKPMRRTHCVDCATQSGCPLGKLPNALVAQVLPHVTERAFRRGQVLQRQGEEAGVLRVIKSGSALMYRDESGRASVPVAIAAPGQVTGASRLVGFPNPLTVIAMSDTRTCELDVASLERLGVMDDPEFRRPLGEAVFRTLSILADWARVTRLPGVRTQLAAALVAMGAQQKSERIRLPGHVVLAELLGVTRESVARAMGALENDGHITRLGRTYCELHLPQLKTLTDPA